jgi:hypothetical protein
VEDILGKTRVDEDLEVLASLGENILRPMLLLLQLQLLLLLLE